MIHHLVVNGTHGVRSPGAPILTLYGAPLTDTEEALQLTLAAMTEPLTSVAWIIFVHVTFPRA